MLQELTLEEISVAIIFIGGLIGGVKYLKTTIRETISKLLNSKFKALKDELEEIQASVKALDIQTTKNFLVRYLADIERSSVIFDYEKQRFWEAYDHYTKQLGENSQIKEWVERLKDEGKLRR